MRDSIAERFERYELRGELGRGGMAVVYAAFDGTRDAVVALKCLSMERFSPGKQRDRVVALFEREYHALSQLAHPHIIRAYDYGVDPQGPYYTMECLAGESLRARAPRPWVEACALVRDIASALALLHSRSVVHRDVTPLNIQCTPDGRAKLIDFGAMMSAGVARHIVGTPAFTAPESLRQQSLDGRTDLFALGCCLYFAITGQHAYPARSLEALHDVWQTPPEPLSRFASGLPEALEELVRALLSIERDDRPRTAGEVYERLTTIAGLPRDEGVGTAQSYLTRPALVGRSAQLEILRKRAQAVLDGTGSALLVRAVRGLGRSCMLDAAALEATLCGFRVARADAAGGRASSLGAGRQLLGALSTNPALSRSLDELGLTSLVSDGLPEGLDGEMREATLDALTRALFASCGHEPVALIVDDVHAIDEASLALLAGVAAQVSEHRLLIVCSTVRGIETEQGSALALLAQSSRRVDLSPLDAEQSRTLLASLFDDALSIDVLAAVTYRHCRGNPRMLLEAAQRLIEQGLARYEGGTWLINDAPEALSAAIDDHRDLEQRLSSLSPDAVELLEAIAFDQHAIMDLASYPWLLKHADNARMHHALSELVESHWAELDEDRVRMVHEDRRDAVVARMTVGRRQELHTDLATRCVELRLPAVYEAHHRLGAGDPMGALLALERFTDFVEQHPNAEVLRHPITLATSDAVSRLRDVAGAHPGMPARYLAATALNATYLTLAEFAAQRLPAALASLAPYSGMQDYLALAHLPAAERLTQALTLASERCNQPGIGALDILGALTRQTQLSVSAAVIAHFMADAALFEAVPDLTAFRILSPALDGAAQIIDALSKLVRGQTWLAWDALVQAQRDLRGPAAEQIDPLTRMVLDRVVLGLLCEVNADFGTSNALSLIDEYALKMPDLAASDRARHCLAHGDLAGAAEARRRFEVISVRTGALANARIIELPAHLSVYALCGDIIGLRRTHRMLHEVAKTRPSWQPRVELALAQLLLWRGDLNEGSRVLGSLLTRLAPPHADWQLAAVTHLELLIVSKRGAEAVERGRAYLASARGARLQDQRIACVLAQACLVTGANDQAEQYFGEAIAPLEARSAQGIMPGCAYEVGARIAWARGDVALFQDRVDACGKHFRLGKHPALTARYNALTRTGARAGQSQERGLPVQSGSVSVLSDTLIQSLKQLAGRPIDDADFYRGLLDRLLDGAAAVGGVVYVNERGVLRRVAVAGPVAVRPDLDCVVARHCALNEATDTSVVTQAQSSDANTESSAVGIYTLEHEERGARSIEGALVLEFATLHRPGLAHSRLAGIAAVMAAWARTRSRSADGSQARSSVTTQTRGRSGSEQSRDALDPTPDRD